MFFFIVRLSDDVPVQSDTIPLINTYFTLCMSFSLSAMVYFSMLNLLKDKKPFPICIRYFTENYICYIMCVKLPKCTKDNEKINNNNNNEQNAKILLNNYEEKRLSRKYDGLIIIIYF